MLLSDCKTRGLRRIPSIPLMTLTVWCYYFSIYHKKWSKPSRLGLEKTFLQNAERLIYWGEYIYIYIYIYTYMCVCVLYVCVLYVWVGVGLCAYVHVRACVCVCKYEKHNVFREWFYIYLFANVKRSSIFPQIYIHILSWMLINIYIYIYIHIYWHECSYRLK